VFVTHGEEEAAKGFGEMLREKLGVEVTVPGYRDSAVLE
jgi:hypothetical protein